jgi:hypothetical protein
MLNLIWGCRCVSEKRAISTLKSCNCFLTSQAYFPMPIELNAMIFRHLWTIISITFQWTIHQTNNHISYYGSLSLFCRSTESSVTICCTVVKTAYVSSIALLRVFTFLACTDWLTEAWLVTIYGVLTTVIDVVMVAAVRSCWEQQRTIDRVLWIWRSMFSLMTMG